MAWNLIIHRVGLEGYCDKERSKKIDCGLNGKVISTGATTKFQLRKGLTPA